MLNQIVSIFVYVLIGAMVAFLIRKKIAENKEQDRVWSEFAQKYGFKFQGECIAGIYEGLRVSISRYAHQSYTGMSVMGAALDKDKGKVFTIVKVSLANLPDEFQLQPKNSDLVMSVKDNLQIVKTNDSDFDNTFMLYGKDEAFQYLTPERRKCLFDYAKVDSGWRIESKDIVFSIADILSELQVFEKKFKEIVSFAKNLD